MEKIVGIQTIYTYLVRYIHYYLYTCWINIEYFAQILRTYPSKSTHSSWIEIGTKWTWIIGVTTQGRSSHLGVHTLKVLTNVTIGGPKNQYKGLEILPPKQCGTPFTTFQYTFFFFYCNHLPIHNPMNYKVISIKRYLNLSLTIHASHSWKVI